MQASLTFHFPPSRQEGAKAVEIGVSIPFPAQRPRSVLNFFYLCTGELPPAEMVSGLVDTAAPLPGAPDPREFAYPSGEAAQADGLLPFSKTSVVHIDKEGLAVMEIGSSTTKSIYGGFLPDELLASAAGPTNPQQQYVDRMRQLRRGTLLCGNAGSPHTQGSRYYLVLEDITDTDKARELQSFAPFGLVTSPQGMTTLLESIQRVAVHPRTLCPVKKIEMAGCTLTMDYRLLMARTQVAVPRRGREGLVDAAPLPRMAGHTRGREEDEEEEPVTESGGFFQFNARFPTSMDTSFANGQRRKRRRLDTGEAEKESEELDLHTAVAPGTGEAFDYFRAQETAFDNDIETIREKQNEKIHRKMRRMGKQKVVKAKFGSKAQRVAVLAKISGGRKPAASAAGRHPKRLKKRY